MATELNVTPAGNNLFQVEVEQARADERRGTVIEVAIPDGFLDDLALEGDAGPQDVVVEAVRFVLERADHPDQLEERLSLDDVAEQYPGFTESIGRRLDDADKGEGTVHEQHTGARRSRDRDADARLIDETRDAQDSGSASQQTERF